MRRCPECRRDYVDDTLLYCLDDGTPLLDGPRSVDEPTTAILSPHSEDRTAVAPHQPTGAADPRTFTRARAPIKRIILAGLLVSFLVAVAFAAYRYSTRPTVAVEHFKDVKLDRVTAEGSVESATISPDGKYIAYSLEESGSRSLWTKHLGSESRVQIVPPVESISMFASAFSPDGGYVYYTRQDDQNPRGALYAVPVLGGTPRKIVSDVAQPVSVSRDGKQVVFGRYKLNSTDDQLSIINSDGSHEHLLATVHEPDYLQGSLAAWSPDGKAIAIGYGAQVSGAGGPSPVYKMNVAVISLADLRFKQITTGNWPNVGSLAWLNDGTGMIFVATERRSGSKQIWKCSYPSGEASRVTNDLNSYDFDSISLTADDKAFIAVQKHPVSQIWIAPDGNTAQAHPLVTRKNVQDGRYGLGWTPDGRVVYDSSAGANSSIWSINADGTGAQQLTDGSTDDFAPEVSPDGHEVIFGGVRNGFQIWGMGVDGANQHQITYGTGTPTYSYSPDGRWIISNPYNGGIFKTPVAGGDSVELVHGGPLVYPQISPAGDLLAYVVSDNDTKRPKIVVIKSEDGQRVKEFDLPVSTAPGYFESLHYRNFHWTPDGRALVYINTLKGVSNLWRQSLESGPPKQVTDFKSDRIYTFAYSRDGKSIAFARGSDTPDAVLVTDMK